MAITEATTSPRIVPIPVDVLVLAALEATDAEVGDRHESIDIGPFGDAYLRVCAEDLTIATETVRRLLDEIDTATYDARQARMDAERHDCYCRTRLEPDETTCRSPRCERLYAQDHQL